MHVIIVTGYSRGIGRSLVHELQERRRKGNKIAALIFVGRSRPDEAVFAEGDRHVFWDLAQVVSESACRELRDHLLSLSMGSRSLGLLYAAGSLGPMGSFQTPGQLLSPWEWQHAASECYAINASSFAALAQIVVNARASFREAREQIFVMHLSSGAALSPYPDLESYCASKAAALMHARCLALRHPAEDVAVLSIAPGTVRTAMTETLGRTSPEEFPELQKFRDLLVRGELVEPVEVSAKIVDLILAPEALELRKQLHGKYYDLRKPGVFV